MSAFFFFSSRRRHTRLTCDWSSDVCSSDLLVTGELGGGPLVGVEQRLGHRDVEVLALTRPLAPEQRGDDAADRERSEERRVGKECRSRLSAQHEKKK